MDASKVVIKGARVLVKEQLLSNELSSGIVLPGREKEHRCRRERRAGCQRRYRQARSQRKDQHQRKDRHRTGRHPRPRQIRQRIRLYR